MKLKLDLFSKIVGFLERRQSIVEYGEHNVDIFIGAKAVGLRFQILEDESHARLEETPLIGEDFVRVRFSQKGRAFNSELEFLEDASEINRRIQEVYSANVKTIEDLINAMKSTHVIGNIIMHYLEVGCKCGWSGPDGFNECPSCGHSSLQYKREVGV